MQRLRVEGLSIEATAIKWVQQWLDKQPDPAQAFEVVIQQLPKATCTRFLCSRTLIRSTVTSNVLNTDILNTTISGLVQNVDSELKKHTIVVIPSTSFPHHRYNFSRNGFLPCASPSSDSIRLNLIRSENDTKHALHGDAKDKIGMFRYRLGLVRQRYARNTVHQLTRCLGCYAERASQRRCFALPLQRIIFN